MRQATFFQRFGLTICIVAIVSLPVLLYGAKAAFDSQTNDVVDWLPKDSPETRTIYWFAKRFGTDAILVVSWPGCTLGDERLDRMREELLAAEFSAHGGTPERLFHNVFTGRDTLEQLTAPPVSLPREIAISRMRGWLVGPGESEDPVTCAVAFLTTPGWNNRAAAVDTIHSVAHSLGISSQELRLGGPAVDSVAIDAVSEQWLVPLGAVSVFCGLAIAWYCLRKIRYVCALFFYAILAWCASLSAVSFSGNHMDAVLATMPALIYVLAVSASVHMTGYYLDARRELGAAEAPYRAFQLGWAPCTAATLTTAFGVGSLMISKVVPVERFGIFAAVGVLGALVLLFTVWPASIQCLIPGRRKEPGGDTSEREAGIAVMGGVDGRGSMWWMPLFRLATSYWPGILLLLAVSAPVLGVGVSRIRTSVNLSDLFSTRSRIIRDYSWLESNVGPLIPVEVVLRFPDPDTEDPYELLERVQLVERTRRRIHEIPAVGGTLAASTFIPHIPTGRSLRQTARRGVLARQVLANRQQLIDLHYLFDENAEAGGSDTREELWRISGRVEALSGLEYPSFLDELERNVGEFIQEDETAGRLSVTAEVTGGVFLVAMAQKQLLEDLQTSFLSAFLLVAVAMMVLTRSVKVGLISMVPNVFPALLAFGVMGWLDMAIDIGTMMSASVALGIAVDDASHFLTWLRRGLRQGLPRIDAIRYAYEQCATAMLATSLICGLGMLVFAISPFMPVARFACLMSALMFAALMGNLVLLAAILASPVGRFLEVERETFASSDLEGKET